MKKKIISILLFLITIFYLCPTTAFAASLGIVGDVNCDGQINSQDAFCLRLYISGKTELNSDELYGADINRDGNVTSVDSFMLKRSLAGALEKGYRLVVNDKDITKESYELYQMTYGLVEVPILAIFEAMGAKITYRTDTIVDIAYGKLPGIEYYRENYVLFLDEQRLVEAECEWNDYNIIKPVPGGTMKCRTHEGDVVVDFLTFRGITATLFDIFSYVDFDFKLDYKNKTIYIWGEI